MSEEISRANSKTLGSKYHDIISLSDEESSSRVTSKTFRNNGIIADHIIPTLTRYSLYDTFRIQDRTRRLPKPSSLPNLENLEENQHSTHSDIIDSITTKEDVSSAKINYSANEATNILEKSSVPVSAITAITTTPTISIIINDTAIGAIISKTILSISNTIQVIVSEGDSIPSKWFFITFLMYEFYSTTKDVFHAMQKPRAKTKWKNYVYLFT